MATVLVDTNVLLRLSDGGAPDQSVAAQALSRLRLRGNLPAITAQNIIEFWAVATRPRDVNGLGWSTQQTAAEIAQLLNRFPLLEDTPAILTHWMALVTAFDIKGKKVHDARLVATMQAHDLTHLLTFNTDDFQGYPSLTLFHPHDVA
jgi:predicted nucleic acid-binding protein